MAIGAIQLCVRFAFCFVVALFLLMKVNPTPKLIGRFYLTVMEGIMYKGSCATVLHTEFNELGNVLLGQNICILQASKIMIR